MRVRWLWSRVLRGVTLWLAQSDEDARRLVAMGASTASVRVIGNLKYDVRAPKESRIAELIKEAAAGRPIVVAGSTVADAKDDEWEEDLFILASVGKVKMDHRALLVIAPRHPERFKTAESLAMTFRYVRGSDWNNFQQRQFPVEGDSDWHDQYDELEIVVLDTIGDLAAVYGVADVAFVGGSLVKRGGHNPLEPAQFGVPVVMGPSYENFRDVVGKMQAADGIAILGQNTGVSPLRPAASGRDDRDLLEELEGTLVRLLIDREAARAMGERGRRVFEEQQGATARAVEAIVAMVKP